VEGIYEPLQHGAPRTTRMLDNVDNEAASTIPIDNNDDNEEMKENLLATSGSYYCQHRHGRDHLLFLCQLHRSGVPFQPITIRSLERYVRYWLPLVAKSTTKNNTKSLKLIPPLDIAWLWHCHRLAPTIYASYCRHHFGRVLDAIVPFRALSHEEEETMMKRSMDSVYWHSASSRQRIASTTVILHYLDGYRLDESCKAQSTFLWHMVPLLSMLPSSSLSSYDDDNVDHDDSSPFARWWDDAMVQYHKFLTLRRPSQQQHHLPIIVPTYH
jgi:hypothetical protein